MKNVRAERGERERDLGLEGHLVMSVSSFEAVPGVLCPGERSADFPPPLWHDDA